MKFNKKNLLGIKDLTKEEIEIILSTSESMLEISQRDIKKVPTLRGKTVINLFFEPSTRTRISFEIAAKRLSADTINFSASTSSVVKGETLIDTARNIEAMSPDIVVLRHYSEGAPYLLSKFINIPIINAGDGSHEHPTQALLDMLTIKGKKGDLTGLNIAIIGDISHSRVARSNIYGLVKMGANVRIAGPKTMIPCKIEEMGVKVYNYTNDAIIQADVIMMLRIQLERQSNLLFPSLKEYSKFFGLNEENIKLAKKDVIVMHPGPINRGVEISSEVADGPYSLILDQVKNGIAIRMAILYLLMGGKSDSYN